MKFLEAKHGEVFDRLLQEISTETTKEDKKSVDTFIEDIGEHNLKFEYWVADQYNDVI